MKILWTKIHDDGRMEIRAEVSNEFLTEEISWFYRPAQKGHEEQVDSDSPMNNMTGYLILGLLKAAKAIPQEQEEEMEQMLS